MLIVGPNLTLDRTGRIPQLRPGGVLRFEEVTVTAGGKGVNVARAVDSLGGRGTLVAFVPGPTGRQAAQRIADEGLTLRRVSCGGELRSTGVIFEASGRVTVLNEPGPAIGEVEWRRLRAAVIRSLVAERILACSGSFPPGSPEGGAAELVELAHGRGALALVDTAGPALARALAASPDLVAPNLAEAEAVLGGRAAEAVAVPTGSATQQRALAAAAALCARGAGCAVVTAASAGLAFATRDQRPRWVPAPRVTTVNPIGAGDAFVAGFGVAREGGAPVDAAVLAGAAAAAASVETALAGALHHARAEALLVEMQRRSPSAPAPPGSLLASRP